MRFSIRDMLWLTLVVGLALGWWVSHRAVDAKRLEAVHHAGRLRNVLKAAKELDDYNRDANWTPKNGTLTPVEWSILDEPLVQP